MMTVAILMLSGAAVGSFFAMLAVGLPRQSPGYVVTVIAAAVATLLMVIDIARGRLARRSRC